MNSNQDDKKKDKKNKGFGDIGRDDIHPSFEQSSEKKEKPKGMFPNPEEMFDSDDDSKIDIYPTFPSNKKKKDWMEPDPDNYNVGNDPDMLP
ncbi:hypothetical protein GINT2_000890 [Glugoides intestinalis]